MKKDNVIYPRRWKRKLFSFNNIMKTGAMVLLFLLIVKTVLGLYQ